MSRVAEARVIVTCPGRNFVTLMLTTEDGLTGLGNATLNGRELAVAADLERHMCPLLIGRDAGAIEDTWRYLYNGAHRRRGPVTMTAIAAVDTALWDIKGKTAGLPVYELLGGRGTASAAATVNLYMTVGIHDVAQRSGVSVATVSRSFTAPDTVRETTRMRVLSAAAALGYRPNRAARGLITGRTGNIGVIVPDLGNPYFQGVLTGAQARAREADYAVFIADGQESAAEEETLIAAMSKQVDGVVLCSSRLAPATLAGLEPAPAVVLLNRRVDGLATVTVDSADGMRQAVDHLSALGHRRCAFVSGPRRSWSNQQRLRGLRAAARATGLEVVTVGPVAPRFEGGAGAAERVLAAGVTAVLAYNDLVAAGILSRLSELGVGVPDELSVVGFDDIPLAAMLTPALTTVAAPTALAGACAVEALLGRLEPDARAPAACERELPASLVVRGSTAAPADVLTATNQGAVRCDT